MTIELQPTTTGLHNARSPIIFRAFDVSNYTEDGFQYVFTVKLWTGDKTTVPGTATWTVKKYPEPVNGYGHIDVSKLILGRIARPDMASIVDINKITHADEPYWCQITVEGEWDTGASAPVTGNTFLAFNGYWYALDGATDTYLDINRNHDSWTFLQTARSQQIETTSGVLAVSFLNDESPARNVRLAYMDASGTKTNIGVPGVSSASNLSQDKLISYVFDYSNADSLGVTTEPFYYIIIEDTDTNTVLDQIAIYPYCSGKWPVTNILFLGIGGSINGLNLYGRSTENNAMTRSKYMTRGLQVQNTDPRASPYLGSNRLHMVTGMQSYRVNTGLRREDEIDSIVEMLLSQEAYIYDYSTGITRSVRINTESFERKSGLNDMADLSWDIDIEEGFQQINEVR